MFRCSAPLLIALLFVVSPFCHGSHEAKRLYDFLFSRYDRLIRPVARPGDIISVKLGLKLSQLIAVDEVSQVVHFNMWVRHEWVDHNVKWNASDFGGITRLYVPSQYLWIPDIVLHNNAEGDYNMTIATKAVVYSTGRIIWEPPAIFKFYCGMEIEFFPYDVQDCTMKFGPWAHSGRQIDLHHVKNSSARPSITVALATDLREYTLSPEWDILAVPGYRGIKRYPCCPDEPYPELFFKFVLRRKPLFYTMTLVVPCVSISFLTLLVFYLPSDSREKVGLCKSILVSLILFFLLLAELLPTTSLAVPLIGKYLMFTMTLVSVSFLVTIKNLNIIHSSPLTYTAMPTSWHRLFLVKLPKLLYMSQPQRRQLTPRLPLNVDTASSPLMQLRRRSSAVSRPRESSVVEIEAAPIGDDAAEQEPTAAADTCSSASTTASITAWMLEMSGVELSGEARRVVEQVVFIADRIRYRSERDQGKRDWKYVTFVIDRMFLAVFGLVTVFGTAQIIMGAPALSDLSETIPKQCELSQWPDTDMIPYDCQKRPDPFASSRF